MPPEPNKIIVPSSPSIVTPPAIAPSVPDVSKPLPEARKQAITEHFKAATDTGKAAILENIRLHGTPEEKQFAKTLR